jgi:hypothetical protein
MQGEPHDTSVSVLLRDDPHAEDPRLRRFRSGSAGPRRPWQPSAISKPPPPYLWKFRRIKSTARRREASSAESSRRPADEKPVPPNQVDGPPTRSKFCRIKSTAHRPVQCSPPMRSIDATTRCWATRRICPGIGPRSGPMAPGAGSAAELHRSRQPDHGPRPCLVPDIVDEGSPEAERGTPSITLDMRERSPRSWSRSCRSGPANQRMPSTFAFVPSAPARPEIAARTPAWRSRSRCQRASSS